MNTIESIICGIIASFIFKWLENTFSNNSTKNPSSGNYRYTISTIKKYFYICAPTGSALLFLYSKFESNSIISTLLLVLSTFFLILALFAFMCCVELVCSLSNQDTNTNKEDIH
nr:hypothetical protein [uncultured Cellulosilyticum sp.]